MRTYTVALLIGRALPLAANGSSPSAAVRELIEVAEGHAEALIAACRHYDDLVGNGADLQSARALRLLRLAVRTAASAPRASEASTRAAAVR